MWTTSSKAVNSLCSASVLCSSDGPKGHSLLRKHISALTQNSSAVDSRLCTETLCTLCDHLVLSHLLLFCPGRTVHSLCFHLHVPILPRNVSKWTTAGFGLHREPSCSRVKTSSSPTLSCICCSSTTFPSSFSRTQLTIQHSLILTACECKETDYKFYLWE